MFRTPGLEMSATQHVFHDFKLGVWGPSKANGVRAVKIFTKCSAKMKITADYKARC